MALSEVVFQRFVVHALVAGALDPTHAARGEIGRGTAARLLLQEIEAHLRTFEGDEHPLAIVPAAYGKHLAANLPDMRATPLNDMGGCMERGAESVVFV